MPLILASASPRRAELLASAGFTFTVQSVEVDETPHEEEPPERYVRRLARAKAQVVASHCRESGTVVLGADTAVVHEGLILGKPADGEDAIRMLKRLAGAVHDVYTGIAVVTHRLELSEVVRTRVHLLPIGLDEIRWYVDTGEPEGKAGAYAIQGCAARFVDWIEGSWSNVVGLPVSTVYQLLKKVS
jgi:nucleoside triphosphate pyrophosphatase